MTGREKNCKQLYDDLIKIIKGHRKSHFFGSLVSVYNPDGRNEEYLVIDGQQRLTTVSLLFLAMYNLIDKGIIVPETANLKQRIYEEYLVDKWQPEDTRIKLKPVKNDQKAFDNLYQYKTEIESRLGTALQWNRGDDIKSSKIFIQLDNVSIENEADWFRMAKFHADWSKKFYDVIVPYIKG